MSSVYTSDEYARKVEREKKQNQIENLGILAGAAGIGYAGVTMGNQSDTAKDYLASLPGANRYSEKYKQSRNITVGRGLNPVDLDYTPSRQSVGRSMNSIIASAEELSPLNLLRTLQLSNFVEPFTALGGNPKTDITHLTGDAVDAYADLYSAQIHKQSKGRRKLTGNDLKHGFLMQDGVLYGVKSDGSIDYLDPVLKNAKLVTSYTKAGDHMSPNRLLEKFANVQGVKLNRSNFKDSAIVAIAGDTKTSLTREWARSYFRYAMEIGYKSLDNPIGGIEELIGAAGGNQTDFFKNPTYQKIKSKLNINLGTKGNYEMSTRDSLKVVAKSLAKVSLVGYLGLGATDTLLGAITPESSMWHNGLISGLTGTYAKGRVAAAKVLADPFQSYKEAQEQAAQDSTKISTLVGLPLVGAMLGASTEYYKRMYNSATQGIEKATEDSLTPKGYGLFDKPLKKIGFQDTGAMKSKAIMGGSVGALIALPFLPGAMIGKSSEELSGEFSGATEVENRTTAGWLMGGGKFEGENVKNFQASYVARTLADVKNKVRYGSSEEKRVMDPILHPFRYLSNPYEYEEMHVDDMPYPVWGMDVSYGSFFGKAFQGTLGEVIKPTVVNAEFLKQVKEQRDLEESEGGVNSTTSTEGGFSIPLQVRPKERSLVNDGLMYAPSSPVSDPTKITIANIQATVGDFTGAKGFTSGLVMDAVGFGGGGSDPQLARSGGAVSAGGDLKDENLGDLMGLGEFVRRVIPHTSSTNVNYINPMTNKMSPNWMPHDSSRYYNNFQQGNYWDKVENGEARLAGVGFNALNKELEGVNPDQYPMVYKYKILSDTAYASPEHLAMKDQLLSMVEAGKLNDQEKEIFFTALEKEQIKSHKREFREYKTAEERGNLSAPQRLLSSIWEPITHNSESVLEPLTPFRPGAKFIHARSAIEDYEKTQLQGPDTAIWTNPYGHFIKPAINRAIGILPGTQVPLEAQERDATDEYFDKIAYLKARKEGNTNAALKTVLGATFGGIENTETMNKFKAGLSADQRLYVDSFSQETDTSKRKKILDMLPTDVGVAYQGIWQNIDIADEAKRKGRDPSKAVSDYYVDNTNKFVKAAGGTSSKFAMGGIEGKEEQAREKRLQAADKIALDYVSSTTGVPDDDWIGWDPRLTAKDIKIRTLTTGKADIFRHGLWDSDVERNQRIKALDEDTRVTKDYERIRSNLTEERKLKNRIENNLFEKGFKANRVEITSASRNDVVIRDDQR